MKLLCPIKTNEEKDYHLPSRYYNACKQHGIELIIVGILHYDEIIQLLDCVDGLFLSGGRDIDPMYYKEIKDPRTNLESKAIDEYELLLIDIFYKHKKLIFGICRGFQVINVYFGGTLHQHIENHNQSSHHINIEDNTPISVFLKDNQVVNSYHHQAINKLATELKIVARSSDGIIEAFYNDYIYACQWHPELDESMYSFVDIMFYYIATIRKEASCNKQE